MLPGFNSDGLLPPGDYEMTFSELRSSILVAGPGASYPDWDMDWRGHLVDNLEVLANQLWRAGITEIIINGSFVEDKDHPNDIDGYFVCEPENFGPLIHKLNRMNEETLRMWDWSLIEYNGRSKPIMWHVHRVELYPEFGPLSDIKDKYGNDLLFPSAFRTSRNGLLRGVVKLIA
jgi:hypothetical protein